MPTIAYPHIEFSSTGIPLIAGTQVKVVEVVIDRLAHNWDADEIHRQYPELSLAQIHAAFTYYYDHQEELDLAIERRLKMEQELLAKLPPSLIREKLKRMERPA